MMRKNLVRRNRYRVIFANVFAIWSCDPGFVGRIYALVSRGLSAVTHRLRHDAVDCESNGGGTAIPYIGAAIFN